ncbi:hypothetical protein MPTK2_1g02490 [Marchantia polymorpha subsp. ruderalis]
MAAQVSEESNDRTSASADGEEKWTHRTRIDEELKRVAEKMPSKEEAEERALPTILRASAAFREHGEFGYEFRYDPVYMRLGLYSRGALLAPTAAETRRMEAAIAFVKKLNERTDELGLSPIDWHEMCARVVPSPARVRWLWSDAPSDMTDDDVRHLLAIDAVYMLCFFRTMGDKFPEVQALDPYESDFWTQQGTMQDILLMENQIPLELIQNALALALERDRVVNPSPERVAENVNPSPEKNMHKLLLPVLEKVLRYTGLKQFSDNFVPEDSDSEIASVDHWLDFVYRVVVKKSRTPGVGGDDLPAPPVAGLSRRSQDCQEEEYRGLNVNFIPTASKLRKAGIAVKGLNRKHATIYDYKMEQGLFTDTLWIPKLEIWDDTANSLRNLLLMEMRSQCEEQPLMEYLAILKQLVDTREDVVILCDNTDDYVILNKVGDAGIVEKLIDV